MRDIKLHTSYTRYLQQQQQQQQQQQRSTLSRLYTQILYTIRCYSCTLERQKSYYAAHIISWRCAFFLPPDAVAISIESDSTLKELRYIIRLESVLKTS